VRKSLAQLVSSLTIGGWFKMGTAASQELIAKLDAAAFKGFMLRADASGYAEFAVGDGTDTQLATDNVALNTTSWYFLVGVYDGANAHIYVNGVLEASQAQSVPADTYKALKIGSDGTGFGHFNGSHTFVASKALTAGEIRSLYTLGRRAHTG